MYMKISFTRNIKAVIDVDSNMLLHSDLEKKKKNTMEFSIHFYKMYFSRHLL